VKSGPGRNSCSLAPPKKYLDVEILS
jgi:hypothetical protein